MSKKAAANTDRAARGSTGRPPILVFRGVVAAVVAATAIGYFAIATIPRPGSVHPPATDQARESPQSHATITRSASGPTDVTRADVGAQASPAPQWVLDWSATLHHLKALAARAPEAAIRQLESIRDKHERKTAAVVVLPVIAAADPALALDAAWRLDLGRFADSSSEHAVLETLARSWAKRDLGPALDWAATLPADEEYRRDHVIKGIAAEVSVSNPKLAAELVVTHVSVESPLQADAFLQTLGNWSAMDYRGALLWVSTLPSGVLRERALDQLADITASFNPREN